jgi:tRNA(Ile)-lysidine synthase
VEIHEPLKNATPKTDEVKAIPFADQLILPDLQTSGIIALSGGADSVCLTRVLCQMGCRPVLAHLNHQLRGNESDRDAAFVVQLARAENLTLELDSVDVKSRTEEASLENVCRGIRYEFLLRVARKHHASWVATGHTADDQAETVIHRILRGTGLQGLQGISPKRMLGENVEVIRPLLKVTRSEIEAYLQQLGQSFCSDSSNLDSQFTRNRIRHKILPVLKEESPALVELLGRLAEQAGEVQNYLGGLAESARRDCESPRAGRTIVIKRKLLPSNDVLLKEMVRLLWIRENWSAGDMTQNHWNSLVAMIRDGQARADFPCRIRIINDGRVLLLEPF